MLISSLTNKYPSHMSQMEHLSEPWFSLVSGGLKKVEGRRNNGKWKTMKTGNIVVWENENYPGQTVSTRVIEKKVYKTFSEYLEKEGLMNCLPGISTLEEGIEIYHEFYTKEDEKEYGVVALHLTLVIENPRDVTARVENPRDVTARVENP